MSLNKVMLIGNVGRDPEVRYLEGNQGAANATKVASFTLATTERYRDRNGETRENTEWHNIVAWRNSADLAERFIRKGTQIYVEGKLRTRSWTDQQGVKKYTTEVIVDSIQLLGKKSDNPGADGQPTNSGYQQSTPASQQGGYNQYGGFNQPAGFQPRPAVQAQPAPQAPQGPAIDIMADDGTDDLPF